MYEVQTTFMLRSGEKIETSLIEKSEIFSTCIDIMRGLNNPVVVPLKEGYAVLRSEDILYIKIKCVQ